MFVIVYTAFIAQKYFFIDTKRVVFPGIKDTANKMSTALCSNHT